MSAPLSGAHSGPADAHALASLGFDLVDRDVASNSHFVMYEFRKSERPPAATAERPDVQLKPCIYKRR